MADLREAMTKALQTAAALRLRAIEQPLRCWIPVLEGSRLGVAPHASICNATAVSPDPLSSYALLKQVKPLLACDDRMASDWFAAKRAMLLATLEGGSDATGSAAKQLLLPAFADDRLRSDEIGAGKRIRA